MRYNNTRFMQYNNDYNFEGMNVMRTYEALKDVLIQMQKNDYTVPDDVPLDELINDMLAMIGHTDGELRDGLIYEAFCAWTDQDVLNSTQMRHIVFTALDAQHLFYGIGETNTDSVFTRSFSALAIYVILWTNENKDAFLSASEIINIKNSVLDYIRQEKDDRGYVFKKGWAHAIAHIADVLSMLVELSNATDDDAFYFNKDALLEILDAVKYMVENKNIVYTAQEDDRLAAPVMDVIWREVLTEEDIMSWIDHFKMLDADWRNQSMPYSHYQYINSKNFMRSLYFQLIEDDGEHEDVLNHLLKFLINNDGDEDNS